MVSRVLNNPALACLSVDFDSTGLNAPEVSQMGKDELAPLKANSVQSKPIPVKLQRTFNQKLTNGDVIRYWRVIGPKEHRNYQSDLSIEGLKDWGII